MRVGLYGGSFNPIHKGHIAAALKFKEFLNLDKVILIPSNISPLRKDNGLIEGKHRYNMIDLVLPEGIVVSDFEIKRGGVSYTFETVKYFKQKYEEIFFLIGSDNLTKLRKWKNIDYLIDNATFVVIRRGKIIKSLVKKYKCEIIKDFEQPGASTDFHNGDFSEIEDKVMEYIGENMLYANSLAKNILTQKRYIHSRNVASMAAEMAKIHGLDSKKAWFTGIFHDITKELDTKQQDEMLNHFNYSLKMPDQIKHQITGALWTKHFYKNYDEDVFSSISKHTTAAVKMSKFDKLIYLSDALAIGRKFEGIQKVRELFKEDLEKAFVTMLSISKKMVLLKHKNIDSEAMKIYNYYLGE